MKDTTIKRCKKISYENPNGIKQEMNQILQGFRRRLKLQFIRKNTICNVMMQERLVEEKLLLTLKLFAEKKQKSPKTEDSQENNNFQTPPKIVYCMMLI